MSHPLPEEQRAAPTQQPRRPLTAPSIPRFGKVSARFADQGLAVIPLRSNEDGFAKIPILDGWQTTTPDAVSAQDWSRAEGIGLVLGPNSGNRAAIDIDDEVLAADVFAYVLRKHLNPLMSYTARTRLHLHVVEPSPSPSRALRLVYQGRPVGVELKALSTQIAIPPTPGYSWANESWEPLYGPLADIWTRIADDLGLMMDATRGHRGTAGYPPAFQPRVATGERNNALFIESCRLAEAGITIEKAVAFMAKRLEIAYDPGMTQREMFRTVRSAYKHVLGAKQ